MAYEHYHRRIAPWVWVLIVLAALALVFVFWFAISASNPPETVVVPGAGQQTATPSTQAVPTNPSTGVQGVQPSQPTTAAPTTPSGTSAQQQPTVTSRPDRINIYVQPSPQPKVVLVPKGQAPPKGQELKKVDIPDQFSYAGQTWQPTEETVTGPNANMQDTGMSVGGRTIFAPQDSQPPYTDLYIETSQGSGIYVRYAPAG